MMSKYNIDALRNADGTFREASLQLVTGALRCNHTAHLQTSRGVLAIRPYKIQMLRVRRDGTQYFPGETMGENWLLEFYPTGHKHGDEIEWRGSRFGDAQTFALLHLNGRPHNFEAGDYTSWYSNQADRPATVLAVLGDEVLIEYEMPGTTSGHESTALVVCLGLGNRLVTGRRTHAHHALPKKWITAMHEQGTDDWVGLGQGTRGAAPVPFPAIRLMDNS